MEDSFGVELLLQRKVRIISVLILIFLEDSFGGAKDLADLLNQKGVLILIFLEDSFGDITSGLKRTITQGLNPYFFGG